MLEIDLKNNKVAHVMGTNWEDTVNSLMELRKNDK